MKDNCKVTSMSTEGSKSPAVASFVGAIDQGTTSTRFFIFDTTGNPVASHQVEFEQSYPHPGSTPTKL